MKPLSSSPYSYHFLALRFLGSWLYDGDNQGSSSVVNVFSMYRLTVTATELYGMYGLITDFYLVMGDMKKMTWNLCVTTLLVGSVLKNTEMVYKHVTLNKLRMRLHRDAESRHRPEDIRINDMALKEFKILRVAFYGAAIICIPIWIVFRYVGGELPIPLFVPDIFNLEDSLQFNIIYFLLGSTAIFGIMMTMESELAMYGLLIQISREYKIFLKDIRQINQLYDVDDEECGPSVLLCDVMRFTSRPPEKEVNPLLKKIKTKVLVKGFSERQSTLIRYTKSFEMCFNKSLLVQFFSMSVLIVVLALQLLWETVDLSGNLLYQMGYLYINVMDMFMLCLYSTRLRSMCLDVGETVYSTPWYTMGIEVQKDMQMMIMRSQSPPKITTGKFMEISLSAYMKTMSHLYSWLALIRQLE